MKITHGLIRKTVAAGAAIFQGFLFLFEGIVSYKVKTWVKNKEGGLSPTSSSLLVRKMAERTIHPYNNNSIKGRLPVKIEDMPVERNVWTKGEYYIEEHDATNLHHDFTIIVNGKCYRMARAATPGTAPKSGYLKVFPHLGEKTGWVRQPEHYFNEVPNPSFIATGYGAGTTKVLKHGSCYVMVSDSGAMHVIFEDIDGVYTFIETKDNQVIMMRKHHDGHWIGKHKMNSADSPDAFFDDPNYAFFIKKDGAAVEWEVYKAPNGKKYLRVWSYRPNARIAKEVGHHTQIEHTYRLWMCDKPMPDDMPVGRGRGELWCGGPNGRIHVAIIMNSSHYNARNSGYRPYLYVHDVTHYEGRDVSHYSYGEKVEMMEHMHSVDNRMKVPEYAVTPKEKRALWERAKKEDAVDGVIAWRFMEPDSKPVKIKFTTDKEGWHAATIIDVVPQKGEHADKYAYPVLENSEGVQFQASGKGLSNEIKADMYENPDKYIGQEVRYSADSHFEQTGKPFQPTIKEMDTV